MKTLCYFFLLPIVYSHFLYGKDRTSEVKDHTPEYKFTYRDGLEYYQVTLFDYLYKIINKEQLLKYNISDFTNKKSNTLNFFEAVGLFLFSLTNKKYDKYVLWALERLYVLSADAKLSELLLWNLACEYEKHEKFRVASELYNQFKKIFPGSSFYWTARFKEINAAYNFCQKEYHDIYDTEKTIRLAQEYITDAYELNQPIAIEIVDIMQDLSLRMIKKTIDIGRHYLKKNKYTYDSICILSSWQRLDQLLVDINYFSHFKIEEIMHNKVYIKYQASLEEMKRQIAVFTQKHDTVILPSGNNYQNEHNEIIQYINENKDNIIKNLTLVYEKINYCIESYYEI